MSAATIFGQIAEEVHRLLSAPPVCANVYRWRIQAVPRGADCAVVVRIAQTTLAPTVNAKTPWHTVIDIECYARARADASPDEAVDALLEAVNARLTAQKAGDGLWQQAALGGIQWSGDAAEDTLACAVIRFTFQHFRTGKTITAREQISP